MPDEILWTVADGIATVTLNRPDKRNALNRALLAGLRACFDAFDRGEDVRVVVVRGGVIHVLQRVERSRHPTIAMVHGDAIAGGCELALYCDLRMAADVARFGMPLARIGLVVPFPLGQKLVEIVGPSHTRQLLFTGRPIDARRAYEIGMVHQVVPSAELESVTSALTRTIADNAPLSLQGMKATILRAISPCEQIAHEDLDALVLRARQSADASEGRRAMLEKRQPVFRGE